MKVFQVDYVRSALMYALMKNRSSEDYFDDTDIEIYSFYEHLVEESEVQRYVESFQTLAQRQNREQLIGFGIVSVTDTPTIVNNKSCFISPFEWACSIRVNKYNRDEMLETLYKVMEDFRGKKVDIATLNNGKLQPVGTIGNTFDMNLNDYDYIGEISGTTITSSDIATKIASYVSTYGFVSTNLTKVFLKNNGLLKYYELKSGTWTQVSGLVPDHTSFEQHKLDISFTDIKMNEPYTLDGNEYCDITFGGGATLTTSNIRVGNDLVKVFVQKNKIVCSNDGTNDFTFTNATNHLFDPIEKGSGNSANSIENKLRSNFFTANSHTDSVAITHEYTFALDTSNALVNQWFEYANYGLYHNGTSNALSQDSMTPNIIYNIKEIYSSWGVINSYTYLGKIVEDIDIGDTDSDIMTLKVSFQLQGTNN